MFIHLYNIFAYHFLLLPTAYFTVAFYKKIICLSFSLASFSLLFVFSFWFVSVCAGLSRSSVVFVFLFIIVIISQIANAKIIQKSGQNTLVMLRRCKHQWIACAPNDNDLAVFISLSRSLSLYAFSIQLCRLVQSIGWYRCDKVLSIQIAWQNEVKIMSNWDIRKKMCWQ